MSERFDNHKIDDDNEEGLAQLLREAGARDVPSAELMQDVRRAVHAEWQSVVSQRRRRHWLVGSGLAASVAVAALATTIGLKIGISPATPVASVARVEGTLQMTTDGGEQWRVVQAGETLMEGATLRTNGETRAALDFGDGVSVRIDSGSLLELKSQDRIALDDGAVYVDAEPRADLPRADLPRADLPRANLQARAAQQLSIETLYGTVRHLGTQYLLRTVRSGVEVSVREGRVEIVSPERRLEAASGEQLMFAGNGEVSRSEISAQDSRWHWATDIAPVFDIERQPLARFLEWVARETGKQIAYATPEIHARAEQMLLRGSVTDLPPEQALAAVLATTPFKYQSLGSEIQIQL
jgi:ferric-dicitrate binding protein FerR (iron transport regulator)